MQILKDVVSFIVAVLKYWMVLMGGLIMTVIALVERERGNPISPKIYWPVIIGFVAVAVFLAWRTERRQWERFAPPRTFEGSAKTLVSVFEGRTSVQGEILARSYYGKWMKVTGSIYDNTYSSAVWNHPFKRYKLHVDTGAPDCVEVFITFKWKRNHPVAVLKRGDVVTAFGRIDEIAEDGISLTDSELVEIKQEATPPLAKT